MIGGGQHARVLGARCDSGGLALFLRYRLGFEDQAAKASPKAARSSVSSFFGAQRRTNSEYATVIFVAVRVCTVSFRGVSCIRHSVEIEAETLYEAVVVAVTRFRKDIWGEAIGPGTPLDVEVREPSTTHSLTLQQVERWLAASSAPYDASKKAKLKLMLVKG
jgi:hypothetical protein